MTQTPGTSVLRGRENTEKRFRDFLEAAPDAMVIVDSAGKIVLVNSQAERLFGFRREDFVGNSVEMLMPERFRASHTRHRGAYAAAPKIRPLGVGLDLVGLRSDGTEFPVEISLSPLESEEERLFLSAIRDITERKKFERELRAKNAALEEANGDLEAFSYSISHDLRAPIRAMEGFAGILADELGGDLSPAVRQVLGRIHENANRMSQLIDGLLTFSRFSRQGLERTVVKPEALAQRAVDELRPEFSGRQIEITIDELPPCEADPLLLQQVFTNLLSNAIKYTRGRNPAVITVTSQVQSERCVYCVRDNGAGFDMEYASKLFRVFQRLHSVEQFEGTGVGLAIVHRIIQRHGGRIWADAQPGRGATFYFTISGPGDSSAAVHYKNPAVSK